MAQLKGRIYVRSFTFVTEKRCHKRVAESEVYIYVLSVSCKQVPDPSPGTAFIADKIRLHDPAGAFISH